MNTKIKIVQLIMEFLPITKIMLIVVSFLSVHADSSLSAETGFWSLDDVLFDLKFAVRQLQSNQSLLQTISLV